jgi:hypothetical protein
MKKIFLTIAIVTATLMGSAQSLKIITLDAIPNKTYFVQDSTGAWKGSIDAVYGIKGCVYSEQLKSIPARPWTGFVQKVTIYFTCPATDNIKDVIQAGKKAVEDYRKLHYPDIN